MGLRLTLQNDEEVLLDLPLSEASWNPATKQLITRELDDSEADLDALCDICDFFSNKRRVQILSHMVKNCNNSASFTDLLKVAVNPKYISDLVNRSSRRELIVKEGRAENGVKGTGLCRGSREADERCYGVARVCRGPGTGDCPDGRGSA